MDEERAVKAVFERFTSEANAEALADALADDVIEKVGAGAQLVYALMHAGDEWWAQHHPTSLLQAYMRAREAYGINRSRGHRHRRTED